MMTELTPRLIDATSPAGEFYDELAFWAVFSTLMSSFAAAFLLFARLGLDTPFSVVIYSVVLLSGIAFSPFLLTARYFSGLKFGATSIVLPVSIAILGPLLAFISPAAARICTALIVVAGVACALPFLQRLSKKQLLVLIALSVCAAYYTFAYMHQARIWFAHAYLPEHALLGVQVLDSYYHAAITNMIQHFHISSTGLDGLARHYYYVGSHYWFAAISAAFGVGALMTYMVVHQVVLLPALFMAFIYSVAFIAFNRHVRSLALIGVGAVLFFWLVDRFIWKIYIYVSESNALSFVFLSLALLTLTEMLWGANRERQSSWVTLGCGAVLVALATVTKATTGVVLLGALAYVWVRQSRVSLRGAFGVAVLLFSFYVVVMVFLIPESRDLQIGTASKLLKDVIDWETWRSVTVVFLLALLLALLVASRQYNVETASSATSPWLPGDSILIELMVILVAVCAVLAAGTYMGIYFPLTLLWIVAPLLIVEAVRRLEYAGVLVRVAQYIGRISALGLVLISVSLCFLALVLISVEHPQNSEARVAWPPQRAAETLLAVLDAELQGQLLSGNSPSKYIEASLTNDRAFFGRDFMDRFNSATGPRIVKTIRESVNAGVGTVTAVYIAPDSVWFWKYTKHQCRAAPFFIPAVAGLPMIMGLPPANSGCSLSWYGFENYGTGARTRATTDDAMCERAQSRGVTSVVVLTGTSAGLRSRVLNCAGR